MKRFYLIIFTFLFTATTLYSQQTPDPPEALRGYVFYNNAVYLSWEYSGSNLDGFRVFLSQLPDTTKILARTLPANQLATFVENLNPGSTYDFWVVAFNQYGQSELSEPVRLTLPTVISGTPDPPTNLIVKDFTENSVTIGWQDNSNNELGFKIAKSEAVDTNFVIIDSVGTDILSYQEIGLTPNTDYFYKVCAYNEYGFSDYTNTVYVRTMESGTFIINQTGSIADGYRLYNNYPNPFNPSTKIRFAIPRSEFVEIKIFDVNGKLIDVILSQSMRPGEYEVIWIATSLNSGTYFYTMQAGDFRSSGKMILLK